MCSIFGWFRQFGLEYCFPNNSGITANTENDDGTWCYCKKVKGGSMINCENPLCTYQWFHMSCLRMKKVPKTWFCPSCLSTKKQTTKPED